MSGPAQYKSILSRGSRKKSGAAFFDVKYLPNGEGRARLGYVVPKRLAPRAVRRNLIKRLIREAFRRQKQAFPAFDLIIRLIAKEAGLPRAKIVAEITNLMISLHHAK